MMLQWATDHPLLLAALLVAVHRIARVLYRLSPIHPLKVYPGPRLAKATSLYRFYHNIYHHGRFIFVLDKLHSKYGT
jgi:hypothetical protein